MRKFNVRAPCTCARACKHSLHTWHAFHALHALHALHISHASHAVLALHPRTHGAVQKRPCMMHMHKMLSLHSCPFCRRQTLRDRWTISSPFPFIGRISPAPCSQEFTRIAPQARIAGRGHSSRETNAWNHSDLTFANGKRSRSDYEVLAQPSPQDQGPSCRSCTTHPALTCPISLRTSFGCSVLTSCCLRAPMMFDC